MLDDLKGKSPEEVVELTEDSSVDEGVCELSPETTHEEAMEVLVAESVKRIEEAKAMIDTAENPLLAIENVIIVASQSGMAQVEVFEQVGFTPKQAKVLESLAKGEAGLGDVIEAFEE